ncbi:MAG: 50S ribosomal protein L9 [Kaiparowitsia implicata GSE-PSE-MK54-09C]|jgi:large subunit ribosomal protein L9|nr:50S ribosomal protein L9 [Kaiparowitsia implicata GSE-PSE-MK54-09C]
MAKRIQLVLNQDIIKLGRSGDLVDVAPGYARNYLLPQGLAVRATPGILKQAERRREVERQRLAELKQVADGQKATLEKLSNLTLPKQVGENDAIFGTVTNREVAEAIQAAAGIEVDSRGVEVPEVRKLGTYTVEVKLHPDVSATVTVEVVAGDAE